MNFLITWLLIMKQVSGLYSIPDKGHQLNAGKCQEKNPAFFSKLLVQ